MTNLDLNIFLISSIHQHLPLKFKCNTENEFLILVEKRSQSSETSRVSIRRKAKEAILLCRVIKIAALHHVLGTLSLQHVCLNHALQQLIRRGTHDNSPLSVRI